VRALQQRDGKQQCLLVERVVRRVQALGEIDYRQRPTAAQMIAKSIEIVTFVPIEYRDFTIKPIDHCFQPFYLDGGWCTEGFHVIKDDCAIMPGAVWFHSIEDAKYGVDCYLEAGVRRYPERNQAAVDLF